MLSIKLHTLTCLDVSILIPNRSIISYAQSSLGLSSMSLVNNGVLAFSSIAKMEVVRYSVEMIAIHLMAHVSQFKPVEPHTYKPRETLTLCTAKPEALSPYYLFTQTDGMASTSRVPVSSILTLGARMRSEGYSSRSVCPSVRLLPRFLPPRATNR